jgi:hypothetical protein
MFNHRDLEDGMKKFACHYAIVRFLPYPETEEFANVGVVVACPETGFFGFKLLKRKFSRVTNFFDEIGKDICSQSLTLFDRELSRINALVNERRHSSDELRSLFNALVHPREAIVRFSETSIRLAENPELAVENLFSFYVERNFVTQEYKELQLVQRVRNVVQGLKLDKPFRQKSIGDELAQASFPLVQMDNQLPIKVIKPFFLGQNAPGKIISHGGAWVDKVQRLRKRNLLPKATLFAIDGPDESAGNRYLAYKEICDDLIRLDVEVIRSSQEQKLINFARH